MSSTKKELPHRFVVDKHDRIIVLLEENNKILKENQRILLDMKELLRKIAINTS